MQIIKVGNYQVGQGHPLMLMAGPCVLEGYERSLKIGQRTKAICEELGIPYVFKASFDKANRSSYASFRGPGIEEGLKLLAQIKKDLGVPVVTDIHEPWQAEKAAEVVDILQIPAFLCRQTDLVWAAAKTGKMVNIKKGQFLSPEAMAFAVQKVRDAGNNDVAITERGTTFGYQDLMVDFRGIPIMKENHCPVILDATHSLQQPNQSKGVTGGLPYLIEPMCRAAIAVGADGLFIETHPNPAEAKSDGANMLPLQRIEGLLTRLTEIRMTINKINQ